MAADDSNSLPFFPQVSVEQVLRDVAEVEADCATFLFPRLSNLSEPLGKLLIALEQERIGSR